MIRLSGPEVGASVGRVVPGIAMAAGGLQRGAVLERFDDGIGTQPVLVLTMPGPASYTREDVVEFHLPGSAPLLQRALERVLALGARAAVPGEFTRRAFLNGRIDLSRAEGVLALVEASDDAERRAAIGLLSGGLGGRVHGIREQLADLCSLCEAGLDFEEEDTGSVPYEELEARLDALRAALREALSFEVRRQPPSTLARVVLVGGPNAGKSTLFNALGTQQALTSEHAGTTRDLLYALWKLEGLDGGGCRLCDTPGLDAETRGVDRTAQERARKEIEGADLHLVVADARRGLEGGTRANLSDPRTRDIPKLGVWNQCDRPDAGKPEVRDAEDLEAGEARGLEWVEVSALEGQGLAQLGARVGARLSAEQGSRGAGVGDVGRFLFARHRAALERAGAELSRARDELLARVPLDLVAQGLRQGLAALDDLEGRTTAEDLLDRIFARFCLGK